MRKWYSQSKPLFFLWFKQNWGLGTLAIILFVITLTNFSLKFGIFGWDNFSVSLDLKTNFFRTFFSTWRDYRGFGVPSDSEVTDVFRQLPLLFFSIFLPKNMVNQSYYFLCLWVGSIGSFFLVKEVIISYFKKHSLNIIQASSLIGALYYSFNFHNIDVFYLPLIMYIVRFAFFPLLVFIFVRFLNNKYLEKKMMILLLFATLFSTPAYLTATTFFTLAIIIGTLIFSFPHRIKRYILLGIVFLLLNSFWLFPFANYTINKASTITKSSTFALVNEFLLNQFAERFSFDKLVTLSSDFSSGLPFKNISKDEPVTVHPALTYTPINEQVKWYLYTPLPFIFIGFVYVLWSFRKKRLVAAWVIVLALVSLFFLRKEYPPLGFVFDWLGTKIPPLKVVLRFGTSKMNILLVLAFSVLSGIGAAATQKKVLEKVARNENLAFIGTTIISAIMVGWIAFFPLTGRLTFPLLKTQIPQEYGKIAQTINKDPDQFRVLHIPFGQFSYWRSYSWGYYGSAFFNFMLDKPLIDKTFSPGSPENDFFEHALNETTQNLTLLEEENVKEKTAEFYRLLQLSGVKYLFLDESIDANLVTKDIRTWEFIPSPQAKIVVQSLLDQDLIELVQEEEISLKDLSKLHNTNTDIFPEEARLEYYPRLKLYKVKDYDPLARSVKSLENIDPSLNKGFISPLLTPQHVSKTGDYAQTDIYPYKTYPFWYAQKEIEYEDDSIYISQDFQNNGTYEIDTKTLNLQKEENSAYDVYIETTEDDLIISAKKTSLPFDSSAMQGTEILLSIPLEDIDLQAKQEQLSYDDFLTNWHVLGNKKTSNLRLQLDETILPLQYPIPKDKEYLASVLLPNKKIDIALFKRDAIDVDPLKVAYFNPTANPNCYDDKKEDYASSIDFEGTQLTTTTYHGTTCLGIKIAFDDTAEEDKAEKKYIEVGLEASQHSTGQEQLGSEFSTIKMQQAIRSAVSTLQNYTSFAVCLKVNQEGLCLNRRAAVVSGETKKIVHVSSEQTILEDEIYLFLITPTFNNETQKLDVDNIQLKTFSPLLEATITPPYKQSKKNMVKVQDNKLSLRLPYLLSRSAYYMNPKLDAFQPKQRGYCLHTVGDHRDQRMRMIKKGADNQIISYIDDCYQGFFVYIPLEKKAAYLWSANYHLFTGSQPQFIAVEPLPLKNEYVSFFADYPNIPGFKNLQKADTPFTTKLQYERIVTESIQDIQNRQDSIMVPSYAFAGEQRDEFFEFHQTVANQALISLESLTLFAFPEEWQNMVVKPKDNKQEMEFDQGTVTSIEKIIPSLWKLKIQKPAQNNHGKIALQFGQAYDEQWEIYAVANPGEAFLGQNKIEAEHIRINGWSNGWILDESLFSENDEVTLIAFYIPERLAILGWSVTILTTMVLVSWLAISKTPPKERKVSKRVKKLFKDRDL